MSERTKETPVWQADLGNGMFQNPILFADYSDPDVIRVGEDFYMVSSSFAHTPVLPILHSKDLVNWIIIGHVADKIGEPGYDRVRHGDGVWAPSIRHHDGKFWVYFGMPDEGIYMSTAVDPKGPWTPLHCVKQVKGWIDCCPFWDDDGNAYLVHAFANSRCGIKHKLNICRMSPDGGRLLDDGVIVFDGTEHHPTMEGPKLYKRNGWYYIFAPAGGVKPGWQTVLRSRHIFGPYEDKIVLHQGNTDINGPHQGGFVELDSGEAWFIHFQDRYAYGRIIHLQPMCWVDDWPEMGEDQNGDGIGEPVNVYRKPNVGRAYPVQVPQTSDDFFAGKLGLQWQWQADPKPNWYSLTDRPGHILLRAVCLPDGSDRLYHAPQLLMQKFPAEAFTASTKLMLSVSDPADRAGLIVFGHEYAYLSLSRSDEGGYRLTYFQGSGGKGKDEESQLWSTPVSASNIYMKVDVTEGAECKFSYSLDGKQYSAVPFSFTARAGHWVGAKVGLFAARVSMEASGGYADFDYFHVVKQN